MNIRAMGQRRGYSVCKLCFTLCILLLLVLQKTGVAQEAKHVPKKVRMEFAEYIRYNKDIAQDAQILVGQVHFIHEGMDMFCDSALLYSRNNSLKAYGDIHIINNDSLHIYGDRLFYDGDKNIAELRGRVKMVNNGTVLTTDSLNYDRVENVAYYFEGGRLVDSVNTLNSLESHYYPHKKLAYFSKDVVLNNPQFDLFSDTLIYDTQLEVAHIRGPSEIFLDSTYIYAEEGYYKTRELYSKLTRAGYIRSGSQTVEADIITYDQGEGLIYTRHNVVVKDSVKKFMILGHQGFVNEKDSHAWVTDSALFIDYSRADTFYVHADTIKTQADSIYKRVYAYEKVRVFSEQLQGKCDSLSISSRDTITRMYKEPVLWSEGYQLTGDHIQIIVEGGVVDRLELQENAMIVWYVLNERYSQLKGNTITGYMQDSTLRQIAVNGSVQCVYMMQNEQGLLVGENVLQSSYMNIDFKAGQVHKLKTWPASDGTVYPPMETPKEEAFLRGFQWLEHIRPKTVEELFY